MKYMYSKHPSNLRKKHCCPGEGKHSSSILSDTFEELAFLYFFPTSKFGYRVDQEKLSYSKCFN